MMDLYDSRFSGLGRLYGVPALQAFNKASVMIIGLGGVGTWVAEALARSGVGKFVLVDLDDICITNTNRQLHALTGTHGLPKIEVMAARIKAISPQAEVEEYHGFYTEKSSENILSYAPDIVVDAIDAMQPKTHLIATCYQKKIPLVTCGGAGGRVDATQIRVADLSKTQGDPMLSQLRRLLRKNYQLPLEDKSNPIGIPCVYSGEKAVFPTCDGGISSKRDEDYSKGRMSCEAGFGSATHITGTFGFMMAGQVLQYLAHQTELIHE